MKTAAVEPPVPQLTPEQERARRNFRRRMKRKLMSKTHWKVISRADWPAIQASGQDSPLIIFANDTVLGERAARRWAELICSWMNEQMRLGVSTAKERHCDAMLLHRLKQAERELKKLNLENQDLSGKLIKSQQAARRAASELHHAQR